MYNYKKNSILLEGNTAVFDIDVIEDSEEIANAVLSFKIGPVQKKVRSTGEFETYPDPRKSGNILKEAQNFFRKEASFLLKKYAE